MIKAITVTNFLGESIRIELARPELSGFAITSIDGLGPGKATINISDYSMLDGGVYTSGRVGKRTITLSIKYLWANTIEEARLKSYKYFPINKPISLVVETERRIAKITGYVESNEPDIFSDSESTNISIVCADPYFYSTGYGGLQENVFCGIEDLFEFPFCNDSTIESELELSSVRKQLQKTIKYTGDVDVGCTLIIDAKGDVSNIQISNIKTDSIMSINTDLQAFDSLIICTERGNKSVQLLHEGQYTNLINKMSGDWTKLIPGDNILLCTAESGDDQINLKVKNKIAYMGV